MVVAGAMAGASCASGTTLGNGGGSTTTAHGGSASSSTTSSGPGGAGGQSTDGGTGGQGTDGGNDGGQPADGGACDADCVPLGIAFTGLDDTAQYGSSTGGQAYDDACPTGQVVIGYQGYLHPNGYHGQLQAQCGIPSIGDGGPNAITIATGALTTLEGLQGDGVLWTLACPANQVVVGFSGRSGALLDFLSPDCAPLSITGSPGSYTVTIGATTSVPGVGDQGGSAFADTPCPTGEVATENHLRAGDGIDYFGIGCSTPVVTY
jgi:hypothetical protein